LLGGKTFLTQAVVQPVYVLVMGVTGSGKSTVAKSLATSLNLSFIEADEFHPASNIQKMSSGIPLTDDDRYPWLLTLNHELKKYQEGAVLACSALKESYRNILRTGLPGLFHIVFLEGTYEKILSHMMKREGHHMPGTLLRSQFETLEAPSNAQTISIEHTPEHIVGLVLKEVTSLRNEK
jgi:carbohydrate kinase (thermoresistant glucokinase family)